MNATHPFLHVNAAELPALRAKTAREPFARHWDRLRQFADECLDRPLAELDACLGNSRLALETVLATAFAHLVTGEPRYGDRAKHEVLHSLRATSWRSPAWMKFNKGADLVTGERCTAAALARDWCHDRFSLAEARETVGRVEELGLQPYLGSAAGHGDWWVNSPVSNWAGVAHGGCGLAGLAFASESASAARTADLAWSHLQRFLRQVTLPDGEGHEGVMYWRYGVKYGLYSIAAAARQRGDDGGLFAEYAERLAGYWDIYLHGPDGRYANFNDMDEKVFAGWYGGEPSHPAGGPNAPLCALFEAHVPGGDPLLLWAADHGGDYVSGSNLNGMGLGPFYFLWRRAAPPAGSRPPLQSSVLFRGAGQAILSSPTLWFVMNGGWTTSHGHWNLDLGTFVLVVDGERLVHDLGYGFVSTAEHSTLLFGGQDQPRNVSGQYLRLGEAEGFSYAACDLGAVNPDRPVERWVRHVVLVDDTFIVLMDDVKLGEACDVEWRLQSRLPSEAAADGKLATIKGGKNLLRIAAAWPKDAVVAAEAREAKKNPGDAKGVPVHTVSIRAAAPELETRYLVVLYPQPADGGDPPRIEADADGLLTVEADGRKHVLRFERQAGRWMLAEVNGKSAAEIPSGAERSLRRIPPGDDAPDMQE